MGVTILGASFDQEEANAAFARKFSFNFPLLCDVRREIGMAYGACEEPDAGFARRISYLIGPDGRVERAYDTVKPGAHPREVLQDVRDIVAGQQPG